MSIKKSNFSSSSKNMNHLTRHPRSLQFRPWYNGHPATATMAGPAADRPQAHPRRLFRLRDFHHHRHSPENVLFALISDRPPHRHAVGHARVPNHRHSHLGARHQAALQPAALGAQDVHEPIGPWLRELPKLPRIWTAPHQDLQSRRPFHGGRKPWPRSF